MRRALLALAAAAFVALGFFLLLKALRIPPPLKPVPHRSPFEPMPFLAEVSVWRLDSSSKDKREGAFALGNGSVFSILGLLKPINTLENIIGPRYQKGAGFLGRWSVLLERGGKILPLPDWVAARVRGTPIVITREREENVALYTVNFAPIVKGALLPSLVRLVWVANEGEKPLGGLTVRHRFVAMHIKGVDKKHGLILLSHGERRMVFGTLGVRPKVKGEEIIVKLPQIPPGRAIRMLSFLAIGGYSQKALQRALEQEAPLTTRGGPLHGHQCVALLLRRGERLLPSTLENWRRWRNRGLRITTPDDRVNDFLDTALVLCKAQQEATGAFSPMHGYTFYWVRDANGPIRLFLASGYFEEVRSCLEYHFRACSHLGKVPNSLPLSLEVSSPKEIDWSRAEVPRAEIASLVVLQHLWLWRATGELSPLKSHLPMLERCILGQELRPDGRLPFHGDETYRFPGYFFFDRTGEFPTDYLHLSTLSADSAFLFAVACEGLAEVERRLGRVEMEEGLLRLARLVREATERFYWLEEMGFYAPASSPLSNWQVHPVPFANVNLRPLWVGYHKPEEPKAIRNVLQTVSFLSRGDGMVKTTPTFGYYTGMVPGYLLYNLAAIDHPASEEALSALLRAAMPSGEFCEMHLPDDSPATRKLWGFHHLRPWETGINAEAVIFYLLGLRQDAPNLRVELCPRLPFGWRGMEAEGIRCGDSRLSLTVRDLGTKRVYKLRHQEGSRLLKVAFGLSLPARRIVKVSLDGKVVPFQKRRKFGREGGVVEFDIKPGQSRVVSVAYLPDRFPPPRPIPPKPLPEPKGLPPKAKVVVVTGDQSLVEKYRREHGSALAIDPRLYLPERWLVSALSRGRIIVFDDVLPGPFKPSDFWERPATKRALEEAKKRGARVVYLKRPKARDFVRLKAVGEEVR